MKTILSTLGAFALAFCISQSIASDLGASNPAEPSTNLLDLPTELLLDIFIDVNLSDAVAVAKTHPRIRGVVDYYNIRRLILDRTLEISGSSYLISGINNTHTHMEFQIILDVLKYFGHRITKLTVLFNRLINQPYHEMLNEYISKYGAESLKEIDFHFCYTSFNPLFGLKGSFPNVEHLRLRGATIKSKVYFNKMFPSLRSLDVGSTNLITADLMEHFPYLERLTAPANWGVFNSPVASFKQIFVLNPQLKHLTIPECRFEILQMLNATRPDLESLEISRLCFHTNDIAMIPLRFNNMKSFKCKDTRLLQFLNPDEMDQIPLEFGNLEEIEINKHLTRQWIRIMLENPKLKKIFVHGALNEQQLDQIAKGLEKLEEFTMRCYDSRISAQQIVNFMQSANQLKRAAFLKLHRGQCNIIAQHLPNEWQNVNDSSDFCYFIRM